MSGDTNQLEIIYCLTLFNDIISEDSKHRAKDSVDDEKEEGKDG